MVVLDFMVLVEQSTSACGAGTELLDSAAGFSLEEDGCSGPGLLLDVTVELRKVTVTGKGNYTNGSTTFERTISAFDEIEMAACNYGVSPIAGMPSQYNYVYVWAGTSFTPTVTVSYSADEDDIEFVEGTDYTVTILKLGGDEPVEVTEITEPGSYSLVVKEKVGTKQKQFIIGYEVQAYTISFTAEQKWGGYYSDCNLSLPTGVKAYVITGISDAEATAAEISYIPAGVPVLLYRENTTSAANFTVGVYSGTATAPATNLLMVAPDGGKTVTDAQIYVLYKNEFVLASAGTLPAGRVYLPVTFSSEEEDSRLIIVIDGATAIESCPLSTATSHQDAWYSLDGRKLSGEPTRQGVYVYKGKKVKR